MIVDCLADLAQTDEALWGPETKCYIEIVHIRYPCTLCGSKYILPNVPGSIIFPNESMPTNCAKTIYYAKNRFYLNGMKVDKYSER